MRAEPRRTLPLLSVALAGAGAALAWLAHATAPPPLQPHVPLLVLVAMFALAEVAVVHVPLGRETHSVSVAEVPLVLGLAMADPVALVVARVAGSLLVQLTLRRRSALKLATNTASWTLHAGTAAFVYVVLLGAPDATSPGGWAALVLAAVAADFVAALTIQVAIVLSSGGESAGSFLTSLGPGALVAAVNAVLGLVSVLVLTQNPGGAVLLGVVVAVLFLAIRGYHELRLRHGRLELLYRFTKAVDRSVGDSSVARTVADEAATLLRAQHAAVVLAQDHGPVALAGWAGLADEPWLADALAGGVVRLPRRRRGEPAAALEGTPYGDAMAAPLRGDTGVIGALVVADRLDAVSTFDTDDQKLFEALAGHASIALDNSRLVDRVRAEAAAKEHLALHDQLTGLPNRLAFGRHVDRVLRAGAPAGVMLLDLDRFKEVNDTLGHEVGDELLVEIARRARSLAREDWEVSRLGGDEFAVLVVGRSVAADLDVLAHDVLRAVSAPFRVHDLDVQVRASAGLAVAPQDGDDAVQLLRRAEVAMYEAKGDVSSVSRYSTARDPYSPRRLSLAADLERTLHAGGLDVHYQPQIDLTTGRVVGVEALVRWQHPVHGNVPPDEFVPIAARTGLIRPLTQFVLRRGLSDCRPLLRRHAPLTLSVNLSMKNLLEPELADDVSVLLREADVPASTLVLEMTESEIMADPDRSIAMLHRLARLGVALSVDDFGTGHSSLLHLRSLPIREVKIDRTFVGSARRRAGDAAIVRSVIDLGHNLGLRVVAEGVEEQEDVTVLASWGCNLAQGYYVARPMPAPEALSWLGSHASVGV